VINKFNLLEFTMNRYLLTIFILLLSACATPGTQLKAECEAKHTKFPDIYRCTYDAVVKQRPDILSEPKGKLYLLRGEQLAHDVESGKISDIDAKVIWQEHLVKLKAERENEATAIINSMPKTTPMPAYQLPTGKQGINCSSYQIGNTVNTNCR
jgi:hypothetical protein